jgi:amidase
MSDGRPVLTPGGSSSGSGIAVAANLVAVAVGTETSGSILSPGTANMDVGIKATLGLVSHFRRPRPAQPY